MKKLKAVLLLFVALILLSACGGDNGSANDEGSDEGKSNDENERVSLSTAGTGGAWYPVGGGIANIVSENSDTLSVSAEVSNGGVENIRLINDGTSEFGFANTDIVYEGYHGEGTYEEDGEMDIMSVAYLYPSTFQAVVLKDSGIKSLSDLKGKTVAVGPPASSSEIMGWDILEASGITEDDINGQTISFEEGVNALRDGNVDAVFVMSAAPNSQIMEISTTKDIQLLPVEDDVINSLKEETPYYGKTTIPSETYDGQEQDIDTMSMGTTIVVNPNVSENAVYEFTKHIYENVDEVKELHSIAKEINLENATNMPIPFHPGAKKYYEEQGMDVE
ncbi:TAXI family TRAP transporter solute-binding subunit [Virgibacillus sp. W0181]|uniref:TAXI family TRAP transporter solute-binding subunit n=1 Tax=Virgibacillus sp. W0181 TaxID=3391581 RepID=UPI003F4737D3